MTSPTAEQADLHARGADLAQDLPGLLARAEALVAATLPGAHGRRRAGAGDVFWQYRRAEPHEARRIDWRRSGRSDVLYVQEREWQVPQALGLWLDPDPGMEFGIGAAQKSAHARLLAMALGVGALTCGERVGLMGAVPFGSGGAHKTRIAGGLIAGQGALDVAQLPLGAHAVLMSDFLGDLAAIEAQLRHVAARRVRAALVQILHPDEAQFPYHGRVEFRDMAGARIYDSRRAQSLKPEYLERLSAHQAQLRALARRYGAAVVVVQTGQPAHRNLLRIWAQIGAPQ